MKTNKTYNFRIYPNKTQEELLVKTFGCVRVIYNFLLNHKSSFFKENKNDKEKLKEYKSPTE